VSSASTSLCSCLWERTLGVNSDNLNASYSEFLQVLCSKIPTFPVMESQFPCPYRNNNFITQMSEMVNYIWSRINEQYANERGPGRRVKGASCPLPEAETLLAFGCLMEAANLTAF